MEQIIKNEIQCRHCGEVLYSKTVHDFKMCKCGKCGVDGGLEYLRRLGDPDDYIELSIVRQLKD